jgi:uncharacterized membrane protein
MNEQKIKIQKIAAIVLLVCANIIFLTTILTKTGSGVAISIGCVFVAVGAFTLSQAKKAGEDLKNKQK